MSHFVKVRFLNDLKSQKDLWDSGSANQLYILRKPQNFGELSEAEKIIVISKLLQELSENN